MNSPVALLGMTLFVVACAPVLSSGSTTPVDPRQVQPERPTVATHAGTVAPGYLEIETGPDAILPRGAYFWHEVIGVTVTGTDGTVLGTVRDVYRSGGAENYVVDGGPYGEFDVPGVRDFVRIFAPRRGEIVVDAQALDLVPPAHGRSPGDPERPRAPR